MIEKLLIVKKKQFSKANVFLKNRSTSFNKQNFFDFKKHEFTISVCQNGKLLKKRDIIAI